MHNPLDHHYVPRAFFKPWANNEKKLIVYEKKNSLILPPYMQSTKSICVHKGLYSYTSSVEEQKRNVIESKLFSLIDNNAAKILAELRKINGLVKISDQHRYEFAVFLVSLRLRMPEVFLSNAKDSRSTLEKELLKDHG